MQYDEENRLRSSGPPKSELRRMLTQAVINTGGKSPAPEKPPARLPTAYEVAWAIVASARETGEDPIDCAQRREGMRCRHYAVHALVHVFPDVSRVSASLMCGAPGKAMAFYHNSINNVVKARRHGKGHMAKWWDDAAFARIINVVELARRARA